MLGRKHVLGEAFVGANAFALKNRGQALTCLFSYYLTIYNLLPLVHLILEFLHHSLLHPRELSSILVGGLLGQLLGLCHMRVGLVGQVDDYKDSSVRARAEREGGLQV